MSGSVWGITLHCLTVNPAPAAALQLCISLFTSPAPGHTTATFAACVVTEMPEDASIDPACCNCQTPSDTSPWALGPTRHFAPSTSRCYTVSLPEEVTVRPSQCLAASDHHGDSLVSPGSEKPCPLPPPHRLPVESLEPKCPPPGSPRMHRAARRRPGSRVYTRRHTAHTATRCAATGQALFLVSAMTRPRRFERHRSGVPSRRGGDRDPKNQVEIRFLINLDGGGVGLFSFGD